jgi:hypothetical protein
MTFLIFTTQNISIVFFKAIHCGSGSRPNFGGICCLALIMSLPLETQWLYCLFCSGKPVYKKRVQFMGT